MREKLGQLQRVREVRKDGRLKAVNVARQEMAAIDNRIAQMRQQKAELEQQAANRLIQFSEQSGTMSGIQVSTLKFSIETLSREAEHVGGQIVAAQKEREQAARKFDAAQLEFRAASRAVDQVVMLDEKVADQEAKIEERKEEAENESLGRPSRPRTT